jgi:hypothetical protein
VHVRPTGNIVVKDATDKTAASAAFKNLSVILRNSAGVRSYKLTDDLPPGKYVAELNLDLDPETYKYEKGTLSFEVPVKKQPEPAAPAKAAPAAKSAPVKITPATVKPKAPAAKPAATGKPR